MYKHSRKCSRSLNIRGFIAALIVTLSVMANAEQSFDYNSSTKNFKKSLFQKLSVDDGLSSNTINSIVQDRKGYIWIGTTNGLNRYDGTSIQTYFSDKDNPDSLISDQIISLVVGVNEQLWIAVSGALLRYNEKEDNFITYRNITSSPTSLLSNEINSLYVDSQDRLWVGTNEGVSIYQPSSDSFLHYRYKPETPAISISPGAVISIQEDDLKNIWIATLRSEITSYNELTKLNPFTGAISHYRHDPSDNTSLQSGAIIDMAICDHGDLWLASSRGGVSKYDPEQDNFVRIRQSEAEIDTSINLSNLRISSMIHSLNRNFWLATIGDGLVNYDSSNDIINQYVNEISDSNSISANQVSTLFEDKDQRIWIGTLNRGIDIFDIRSEVFNHTRPDLPASAEWRDIIGITEIAGSRHVLEHTSGQTFLINLQNNTTKTLSPSADLTEFKLNTGRWLQHRDGDIYEIVDTELLRRDNSTQINRCALRFNNGECLPIKIQSMVAGPRNLLWLITESEGLIKYNLESKAFLQYPYTKSIQTYNNNILVGEQISDLVLDSSGNVWLATNLGLNKLNTESDQFEHFVHDPDDDLSLPVGRINQIHLDSDKMLWVSTDNGLISLNTVTEKFTRYSVEDGLASNELRCMLLDNEYLWVASDSGLTKWHIQTSKAINYFASNGIQANDFNEGACSYGASGTLYFTGENGYNFFQRDDYQSISYPTNVAIKSISLDDQKTSFTDRQPLIMSHSYDVVQFEYGALDYTHPVFSQYQVKLENFDENWREMNNTTNVFYTNLDVGEYTFKVRTTNRFGEVSDIASIDIVKTVHPLLSGWMIGTYLISLILIVAYYISTSRRKLDIQRTIAEREKKVSEQLRNFTMHVENAREEERKYITRELHDELAQILVALKLELRWVEKTILKKKEKEVLERLPEMNSILESGVASVNDIAKGLRPSALDDMGIVAAVEAQLLEILERANISPHFTTNCRHLVLNDSMSSNIYRIFQEAMSNILKHAEAQNIWVTLKRVNNELIFFIRDDGRGISDSDFEKPSSYGLIGIQERVKSLHGKMEIETYKGSGTRMRVTIPLSKDSYV